VAEEVLWRLVGDLCWTQHGGSGYAFTRADVLDMEWAEFLAHHRDANERRADETKAIRNAQRPR